MASAFWQSVIRFDAGRIAPEVALRNTIGIVAPLMIGAATGHQSAGAVAAIGAMNVCSSDGREPYAVRGRRMLLATVMVSTAVTVGAISGWSDISAVAAATLWAFGVGMLVVLGTKAGDLGAITLVTLLVFAGRKLNLSEALTSGVLAFSGGLLETALSVWFWPIQPYGPERRILGDLFRALAEAAVSQEGSASPPPASAAALRASETLPSLESNPSEEAETLVFLLNQAERIRLSLLTLRRLARRLERREEGRGPAEALDRVLTTASGALQSIGQRVERGVAADSTGNFIGEFREAERSFQESVWQTRSAMADAMVRDAKHQAERLAAQVRAAAELSSGAKALPAARASGAKPVDIFASRERLRANLSFRSAAFRHAVRLAACVGLGDILGRGLHLERAYWLPMTVAIVLKPDFVGTFSRGILRITGTLAGLLIATAVFRVLPRGVGAEIALLTVFAAVLRWIGPANYGIFVSAVTGVIVLLIAMTGVDPAAAISERAVNTVLGGTLALLAYWIWPTWEKTQIGNLLSDLLDAYRTYFVEVMRAQDSATLARGARMARKTDALRNAARLARSNLEASVSRLAAEPHVPAEQKVLLNEMRVSSHAFVRAAMAIESDTEETTAGEKEAARGFAEAVVKTLERMAEELRKGGGRPADAPDLRTEWTALGLAARAEDQTYSLLIVETDRIAISLNTLWEQIAKWNQSQQRRGAADY